MDIVLITFSQTGNTHKVASAMADAFRQAGGSARAICLKDASPGDETKGDLLGVGTPCFSSQAPTPIKAFLRGLPPLNGQMAFVFATSSGAPGRVLYDLTQLLREKGAEVLGGFLARGQVHHPAPHMTGRFQGHPNDEDLARARQFAFSVVEYLMTERTDPTSESMPEALKLGSSFYELLGGIVSDKFMRFMMPAPTVDPANCDQCRWCVDECPEDNITLHSYPILGDRCIRCYRCLTGCPQRAFDANWRFAGPYLRFLYNPKFLRWFGDLKHSEQIY